MPDTPTLKCLLCGSIQFVILHSLSAEDILKCWASGGIRFAPGTVQSLFDERTIHLHECRDCGFQFFNPALAGGAKFYEQIDAQGSGYYAPNRPENERNARFAVGHGYRTMLDVGCGPGFALDVAKRSGLETFGIELSSTAAKAAAQRGHAIFPVLLNEMDSIWEGKFDMISLNQLLEHVPDPIGLIQQCIRLLSSKGAIAIAVPGVNTILRFTPWLEANWPPHHISRWRIADFNTLARETGLRVIKAGGDQLLGSAIQSILLGHRTRCQALQKPYRGSSPTGIKLASLIYRKLGLKYVSPLHGQSVYCFLGRP